MAATARTLVDPSKLVIVRAVHLAGGVELHESKDCPRDATCPVWADFHPAIRACPPQLPIGVYNTVQVW